MGKDNISTVRQKHNDQYNFLYQPIGFDPASYGGSIARNPDAARWLLSCTYWYPLVRNYNHDDFVELHSDLLGKVMGRQNLVKPIREDLINHGLIECDNHFIKNVKSFGYRIGPALQDVGFEVFRPTGKKFAKAIVKFKQRAKERRGFHLPVHFYLEEWAQRVELVGDLNPVFEAIKAKELATPPPKRQKKTKGTPRSVRAPHQAEEVRHGNLSMSVCSYGRFHSNFSSLCKELRSHLQIDGKSLHEIDVVNSQPYFLAMLLLEQRLYSHNVPKFSNLTLNAFEDHSLLIPSFPQNKEEEEATAAGRSDTPLCLSFLTQEVEPDLKRFVELATTGRLYEAFLEDGQFTRDQVKSKLFQIVFGHEFVMEHALLGEAFKTIFPTVYKMLVNFKRAKGFKWVGQELQRRESKLVIQGVCDLLRREYPTVPVATVHDSIMTTAEHLGLVEGLLASEFRKAYPILPKFRVKGES